MSKWLEVQRELERNRKMKTAYFERFTIEMSLGDALSASHLGDCTADVRELLLTQPIKDQLDNIPPHDLMEELEEYGAWDDDELQNDDDNRLRIVWIAAGNIREDSYETINT